MPWVQDAPVRSRQLEQAADKTVDIADQLPYCAFESASAKKLHELPDQADSVR